MNDKQKMNRVGLCNLHAPVIGTVITKLVPVAQQLLYLCLLPVGASIFSSGEKCHFVVGHLQYPPDGLYERLALFVLSTK